MLSIGLMSGTSMDGIDAALLETDGTEKIISLRAEASLTYHPFSRLLFKSAEYAVQQSFGQLNQARGYFFKFFTEYLEKITGLSGMDIKNKMQEIMIWLYGPVQKNRLISFADIVQHSTDLHIQVVNLLLKKAHVPAEKISVIGYHGQTLFHQPNQKISIVIGDGQRLANELGIKVVDDFRTNDVQAGGQGAPFAPLYHQALAVHSKYTPVGIMNCGGIANVTLIPDADPTQLIAFDTGPGNGLIDRLVQYRTQNEICMDKDGEYARQGKLNESILSLLYQKSVMRQGKNYFSETSPKSLDINDLILIPELNTLFLADACHTLAVFTADSMIKSILSTGISLPKKWILAGGGWHHPIIFSTFHSHLVQLLGASVQMMHANEIGWHGQSLEAQIFAWLAVRSLLKLPLSLPNTTGVPTPMTGGRVHLPVS